MSGLNPEQCSRQESSRTLTIMKSFTQRLLPYKDLGTMLEKCTRNSISITRRTSVASLSVSDIM